MISLVNTSPAILTDLSHTIPPSAITAISVVPPPISTIMFPLGCMISRPIPMAAAMGSWIRYTSLPLTRSADSFTARISTSVIPEGMQMTIRRAGGNHFFLRAGIFLMNMLIIFSEASKSAITPSLSGRMVLMFSWVLPCIMFASRPTAMILPEIRSLATMEGLSTTTLSSCMMRVFAVPRSMAISSVKKSKKPIS